MGFTRVIKQVANNAIRKRSSGNVLNLDIHNIFILPTASGIKFLLLSAVLALMAINYQHNLIYILVFLIISLGIVSILHTFKNLTNTQWSITANDVAFACEDVKFNIQVINLDKLKKFSFSAFFTEEKPCTQFNVDRSTSISVYAPATTRGLHKTSRLTVFSVYPLGFFKVWTYFHFDHEFIVYPKAFMYHDIVFGVDSPDSNTEHTAKQSIRIGVDDFSGLRDYISGDSIRRIHWKSMAKNGVLSVKEFNTLECSHIWVDYNLQYGEREERLSTMTKAILDLYATGLEFGLKLPNITIEPRSHERHLHECLRALALF